VTTTRLLGADISAGLPPGLVAVPVELTGSAAAGLVQPGVWVDVLATSPPTGGETSVPLGAQRVAVAVRVLAVGPGGRDSGADSLPIVVAVDPATALRLASVVDDRLLVTVRAPP
jgi:Flp pilus assembly protein CpaB